MPIFNKYNQPSKENNITGFYYYGDEPIPVDLSNIVQQYNGIYYIDNFKFYNRGQIVSYFQTVTMSNNKSIIRIEHFAVELGDDNQGKGFGYESLTQFAKLILQQMTSVNEINFELYRYNRGCNKTSLELATARVGLLLKIGVDHVLIKKIEKKNNDDDCYIVKASWPRSSWPI